MWIGGFLVIGAAAHASIFIIADLILVNKLFMHRDVIIGHLIWVSIVLGLHSFSLYIHNDTLLFK
jgi:photosystem I P700 chlorophyll a apoprotein A1